MERERGFGLVEKIDADIVEAMTKGALSRLE